MTFAEEKTYQYIRRYHNNFCSIHVLEILPYLYCLTTSDQDRLRAYFNQWGNHNTLWELFHSLQRRQGWVDSFIAALRSCEKTELAEEVASVYQSYLPTPKEPASLPAAVPGSSTTSETPSTARNGYRGELKASVPVQDSQSLLLGEDPKTASQTASSGTDFGKSGDPKEPSSDMAARRPLTSSGHQEQDTEPSSTHTAGAAGDCIETAIYSSGPGVSINSRITSTLPSKLPTSTLPSKLPVNSPATNTLPSKGPTSSKPPGTVTTNVPTNLTASKLPINSARAGTVPPKVPTSLAPDHRMPMSSVPSQTPADTVPTIGSGKRPTEETPASPGAVTGGRSPHPDRGAPCWSADLELSKPGELLSQLDSPFSGCSEDLAISYSRSVDTGRSNTPEENEYQTLESIRIRVEEEPSADLLAGSPRQPGAPKLQKEEPPAESKSKDRQASWAPWLSFATVGALLAGLLAVLYRRRLLQ
ncbi:PREDICTED: mitochondrial antiviral-signaling protein isoform X1 [Condylura cristata]|uniref:mitochondrial antiviral-signaling protein isoform X1 n=1 Tax=Condylura cristata TaxID=143302 RepID=UPI000642B19D|nr:PREDICTED: mitochondrial antiviral-signaling protein isoform X1 [Condylura cristata]